MKQGAADAAGRAASAGGLAAGYRGRTVLITGASGFVGGALAGALSRVCKLVLVVRREPSPPFLAWCEGPHRVIAGDVADPALWESCLPGVDCVFHCAAYEHRRGAVSNPPVDLAVNAGSVLHLLESCRRLGVQPKLVLASSSNVVGIPAAIPVGEGVADHPLTLYAIHKMTAEWYLRHYARESAIPSVALRLVNVYGPAWSRDVALRVVVNRMVARAVKDRCLEYFRNGSCVRDFLFIDDAVAAFLAAGCCGELVDGSPVVVGSGSGITLRGLAELVATRVRLVTGEEVEVRENAEAPLSAVERREFVADTARLSAASGWRPAVSLSEGLDRTVRSLIESRA